MIQYINELASNTSSECVIGSRFTDYKSGQLKQELFTEWELQPMNQTSRNELAERLLPELQKLMNKSDGVVQYNASTFVDALESHSQASSWGENALLFSLAAVIFVRAGKLPLSRVELYQAIRQLSPLS